MPAQVPPVADERESLIAYIDQQRDAFVSATFGLTEEQIRLSPTAGALSIGGLVKPGSLVKSEGQNVTFAVTDNDNSVAVSYQGLLPDLFREGQGVVAEGVLEGPGRMRADSNTGVLAKHDERYMPREVVDALKKEGRWQEGETKP